MPQQVKKTRLTLSTTPRFKRSLYQLSKTLGKPPSQLVEEAVGFAYATWQRLDPGESIDLSAFEPDWALPEMEAYNHS